MTADGFNRLQEELKRIKSVDRPAIIRQIAEARDHGDITENALRTSTWPASGSGAGTSTSSSPPVRAF